MPKKSQKSPLAGKLGKAILDHKDDTTTLGGSSGPPPGIRNGVAKLHTANLGKFKSGPNQGEIYCYLGASIVAPKSVTVPVKFWNDREGKIEFGPAEVMDAEGTLTSQILALCDTKKGNGDVVSIEDNVDVMLKVLRTIGGADCTQALDGSEESLEALLSALAKAGPYFRINTSQADPSAQYPQLKVWENWGQAIDDYDPDDVEEDDVEDDTDDEEEEEEETSEESEESEEDEDEDEDEDVPFGDDLDMLADAADKPGNEDGPEAKKLEKLAEEAGIEESEISEAPSWQAVANLIREAKGESSEDDDEEDKEEEEETEEEEEWKPEKKDVYKFKPKGKRTFVTGTVSAVFLNKQTCNLKDDDGKIYRAVPWDKLEDVE